MFFVSAPERVDERERRRRRRHREELRRDLEIQRAEEAKWGRSQSQPIMQIDSHLHFPDFSPSSFDPSPSAVDVVEQSVLVEEEFSWASNENGRSFAQVRNTLFGKNI